MNSKHEDSVKEELKMYHKFSISYLAIKNLIPKNLHVFQAFITLKLMNWNFPHELSIYIFVCTLYRVSLLIIRLWRLGSSGQDWVLMTVRRG